jgi:putative spermidine/putrescine transport system permease protein
MRRTGLFGAQLCFTLLVCAFMFVPVVLSVMAGFTANYIRGFSSGLTLRWLFEVWALYKDAIGLSLLIALACLAVTLVVGVPTPISSPRPITGRRGSSKSFS